MYVPFMVCSSILTSSCLLSPSQFCYVYCRLYAWSLPENFIDLPDILHYILDIISFIPFFNVFIMFFNVFKNAVAGIHLFLFIYMHKTYSSQLNKCFPAAPALWPIHCQRVCIYLSQSSVWPQVEKGTIDGSETRPFLMTSHPRPGCLFAVQAGY